MDNHKVPTYTDLVNMVNDLPDDFVLPGISNANEMYACRCPVSYWCKTFGNWEKPVTGFYSIQELDKHNIQIEHNVRYFIHNFDRSANEYLRTNYSLLNTKHHIQSALNAAILQCVEEGLVIS